MLTKQEAFNILDRFLSPLPATKGEALARIQIQVGAEDWDGFCNYLEEFEQEGIIKINGRTPLQAHVFRGPKYESAISIKSSSINVVTGNTFHGNAQIGDHNTMTITSNEAEILIKIIDSLAKNQKTTPLTEKVLGVIKSAGGVAEAIKLLLKIAI